jgi:DNA-directed RNA polymerase III subunit RPC1
MNVKNNLVTPRNGEPVIAAIQDFITASFLLSKRDQFFDRRQFTQICCYFADANIHIDIPPPAIMKPVRLWTGKQIFNVLMRPTKDSKILVNVESKCHKWEEASAKFYPWISKIQPDLSPNDGWLVVVNSEIMCGVMDKATVGSGKKKSIFGVIMRDYGPHEAATAMNRLAKLAARYLGMFFSWILSGRLPSFIREQPTMGFHWALTTLFLVPNYGVRRKILSRRHMQIARTSLPLLRRVSWKTNPGVIKSKLWRL